MKQYLSLTKDKILQFFQSNEVKNLNKEIINATEDKQKYLEKYYAEKALTIIQKNKANDLQSSILEYSSQLEKAEDKLLQLNCKMSKTMFSIGDQILQHNQQYYDNINDIQSNFTQTEDISINLYNSKDISNLFLDYTINDVSLFLTKIYGWDYKNQLIPLMYLYLHQERLKREEFDESFNNKITKVKNLKCEG